MDSILQQITDWLKEMLVGGIMSNLSGMFDSVNQQVADVVNYIRTHFGNKYKDKVTAEDVKPLR